MANSIRTNCLAACIVVLSIAGCVTTGVPSYPTSQRVTGSPPSKAYQPIDFAKWSSGMYPDEFFGKSVVVDGYYRKNPTTWNMTNSIMFSVSDKSVSESQREAMAAARRGQYVSPTFHFIPVVAPLSMRDTIYPLVDDQRIRVYGSVTNPYSRSVLHGGVTSSFLQVQAERVEVP